MNTPSIEPRFRLGQMLLMSLALIAIAIATLAYVSAGTHTRAFTDASGERLPNAIAQERRMTLGGVEQYVLLRGKDRRAPLLVFVHGGPGAPETPFLRMHNGALEDDFVVVYWEQRGAVHSYDPAHDPNELTIDRLTKDLDQLITTLMAEFEREKVLLVGHSWGTILALEHVAAHPEQVAAYIAISQTTHQARSDLEGYEWALARARQSQDEETVARLQAIGRPPYTIEEFITQRQAVNKYGGGFIDGTSDLQLAWSMIATDEFSWPNLKAFVQGARTSGAALWPEQKHYDAQRRHPSIEVPIVMVMGRHDKVISPTLAEQYFEQLEAPAKEFVWFENSAHAVPFEEPEKFNHLVRHTARRVGLFKSL